MRLIFALLIAGVAAPGLRAQTTASPTAHWGATILPDLSNRDELSMHFLGFTRYGKEVDTSGGVRRYRFTPYNDMTETLGFNILSYSRTRTGLALGERRTDAVNPGPVTGRTTLMLGFVNDVVPEFLQNEVIHRANWRSNKLERVPRRTSDTFDDISHGVSSYKPPIVGWAQEYFLRLYLTRRTDGVEQRVPTPLFVGGGWQLSTLNHEAFLQGGSNVFEWRPDNFGKGVYLRSAGVGGVGRFGVLRPARYFRDLTSTYANLQTVGRATIDWWGFETIFEYAITGAHGFFVRTRSPQELAVIGEFEPDPDTLKRYQAKTPAQEFFSTLRVRIGEFTFETYNDSQGGKDKGPSFGAYMSFNMYRPGRRIPVIDPVFSWFGARGGGL